MSNQQKNLEKFLKYPPEYQNEILVACADKLDKPALILEKDIWVCLTLDKLFSMPNALNMVFKGGTSLSKAFNIIDRFSEDVDVTIDYRNFTDKDPLSPSLSRTQRDKLSDILKASMKDHIKNTIFPFLEAAIQEESTTPISIVPNAEGDVLEIHYQSVCGSTTSYIKPYVLLEFGARNAIEPNKLHKIEPYIAKEVPTLAFPAASVNVLVAERTFWEKATLIHVECNRGEFKKNAERLSRHWYDLAKLYQSPIGKSAVKDKEILNNVVHHKKVFFNAPYAKYDECLVGNFNLIPNDNQAAQLQLDYEKMVASDMFNADPIPFNEIMNNLKNLSKELADVTDIKE
jgi:hypothetical protein